MRAYERFLNYAKVNTESADGTGKSPSTDGQWDLARLLVDMLEKQEYGIYHATNEGGYISWYDFAKEIFRQAGMDVTVKPVTSAEYPAKAKRPFNSRLEKKKLTEHGFKRLPDWQDALSHYLKELEK